MPPDEVVHTEALRPQSATVQDTKRFSTAVAVGSVLSLLYAASASAAPVLVHDSRERHPLTSVSAA
jgi:hypothetical protein